MKLPSPPPSDPLSQPCPACGGTAAALLYSLPGGDYKKCASCGLVRVDPPPSFEQMSTRAELWAGAFHASPEKVKQVYSANFQKVAYGNFLELTRPYRQAGRLLDVGCSIGGFLDTAQKAGWEAHGLDISPAVAVAIQHGLRARRARPEDTDFPGAYFDVITLFEVIEHIPDLDSLMRKLAVLLRPGGGLLIVTPNLASISSRLLRSRWPAVEPQDHLTLFTPSTLNALLRRYRFSPAGMSTRDINLASLKPVLGKQASLKDRQRLQKERRRFINAFVNSPVLLFSQKIANYFLNLTRLGERLVVLAERRPPS
jgi:2-polyprenyl-3-methyl-5-hydroxy-6-metoxy-1,4-benzoquinol methylase